MRLLESASGSLFAFCLFKKLQAVLLLLQGQMAYSFREDKNVSKFYWIKTTRLYVWIEFGCEDVCFDKQSERANKEEAGC